MAEQAEGPMILILEDDASVREFACKALELEGYRVISAEDGETGLALARQRQPAAILLDLRLPVRSGWSVLEEIRKDTTLRPTSVIVFSASVDEVERHKALSMGVADYLSKPISVSTLTRAVARVVRRGG